MPPVSWTLRHGRLLALVLLSLAIVALTHQLGLHRQFSLAALRAELAGNPVTALSLFVVSFSAGNLLHVPGLVFLGAAVLTLGRVEGGLVTYLAATVSCMVTFWVVRAIGGDALRRFQLPAARRLLDHLDTRPVRSVALLRLLFQTLPALNYSLAVSGIGAWRYLLGTLLGLPLPIALFCVFFDQLVRALPV